MECSSVQLCTQKIHVVNYGYSVTQSHSYFQVNLLGGFFLKCLYITVVRTLHCYALQ